MDTFLREFKNIYQEEDDSMDFSYMNNIVHYDEEGDLQKIYDSPELFQALGELAFTRLIKPYPDEDDIEEYVLYFEATLNGEVEGRDGE